jgi:hypothetical protein
MSVTCDDLWFSPGLPVSSTNKTDRHDIAEMLLKVALNTKKQNIRNLLFVKIKQILIVILLSL